MSIRYSEATAESRSVGTDRTAEFMPVANYPGLTAEIRAQLGEMKVAPVTAEMVDDEASRPVSHEAAVPTNAGKLPPLRGARAVN